jgi:hypothetical protein
MREAVALSHWLPPTPARFGRVGKPNSHHLYDVEPVPATKQYQTAGGTMVIELRSTGAQTVVPPSIHESGEPIEWAANGEPAHVSADVLQRAVARIAAGALLAHTWPAEGSRHTASLALAGALLRADWPEDEVRSFIVDIATVAGDGEAASRGKNVSSTAKRIAAGEKATGWPGVVAVFGKDVADKVVEWLEIKRSTTDGPRNPYADLGADFGRRRPRPTQRPAFPLAPVGVPWLTRFMTEGARARTCPVDFVAGSVLGACSAAIAGAVQIDVMNDWSVFCCLWIVLVGESGSAKGPGMQLAVEPLHRAQSARYRAYRAGTERYAAELDEWERLPKKDRGPRPQPPRYEPVTMDDATTEKVIAVLAENPRGVALVSDELAGWITGMNQYKRGAGNDRQRWLSMRDSTPVQSDRKGSMTARADRPVVPLLGTSQPGTLGGLLRGSKDGLRERLSCVYPPDPGLQPLTKQRPVAGVGQYQKLIDLLLAIPLRGGEDGALHPWRLCLSEEAQTAWSEEEGFLCEQSRLPEFDPEMRAAYAKARGNAAETAGLLAVLRRAAAIAIDLAEGEAISAQVVEKLTATFTDPIEVDVVQAAWEITAYFLEHQRALYYERGSDDPRIERAVRWLEQHGGTASLRDLARAKVAGNQSAAQARELAQGLADRGLARIEQRANPGAGPSTYVVLAALEES